MRRTLLALTLVLVGTASSVALADLTTPEATRRVVENNVGNCLFSTEPMPFTQEEVYKPLARLGPKDSVHTVRCYYPYRFRDAQ